MCSKGFNYQPSLIGHALLAVQRMSHAWDCVHITAARRCLPVVRPTIEVMGKM